MMEIQLPVKPPSCYFYEKLAVILKEHHFDAFVEEKCASFYAEINECRPSIPPAVYFRLLLVGYFEGLDSEWEIAWRLSDSAAVRRFVGYRVTDSTPDHSAISRNSWLIDSATHQAILDQMKKLLIESGLSRSKAVACIEAAALEGNKSMRNIAHGGAGEFFRRFFQDFKETAGIKMTKGWGHACFSHQREGYTAHGQESERNRQDGPDSCGDKADYWRGTLYSIVHNIGNAIFPIETCVYSLKNNPLGARVSKENELILKNFDMIERCLQDVKNIARKSRRLAARYSEDSDPVDMMKCINEALEVAEDHGIGVSKSFSDYSFGSVLGDPRRVEVIFDELVANSIRWLEGRVGSNLSVRVCRAEDRDVEEVSAFLGSGMGNTFLKVSFEDNGPGVRDDLKLLIFELGVSMSTDGSGFGLAIVKSYMESLGGAVVERGELGRGAIFDLFFPTAKD